MTPTPWRCFKTRCNEQPPFLGVAEWGGALFACAEHVGHLAQIGMAVHNVDDVLRDPARRLGQHPDALGLAAQRHGDKS